MAILAAAAFLAVGPLGAAQPGSATVGPAAPSATWTGQFYAAAAVAVPDQCPPAADPANALCDHFLVTVNVAPSYWDTHTGGIDILITWASSDNDFDLYVYDSSGVQVDSSGAGGTTSERVFIENPSGVYEVRVVPFLVAASGYDGSVNFVSQMGGQTPNPARGDGGLAFGPATVVDAQRTEGEPLNWIDRNGNYWESGPYGTSTQQSFIHRSTDGGDQFNIVSPIGIRPDAAPGGGDTDVVTDDEGNAYFVDLEGLANLGVAVSNDDGNNWRKNAFAVASTIDDRQWFAIDNGETPDAADNTVFLVFRQVPLGSFIYSTPGSTGVTDPIGGLIYQNSSSNLINAVSSGAPCGQMRFDPVRRNLYYPCAQGNRVEITVGHVNPGQRTGIVYRNVQAPVSPGGGPVGDIFPAVAVDRAGTLYAVWIDETDHNVYYAASDDEGQSWGPVRQINGNDANSNVFPWAQAGADGTLVVAWYGNASHRDSDIMPSWYANRQAAGDFEWYGYVAMVRDAGSPNPSFIQKRFTDKPMHFGQICNGGLGCTVSSGDRTMADFFAVNFDLDGSLRFVYNDTTSQHHAAHLFEIRQLAGPGGFGAPIGKPGPANPAADPTGDAQSPHYSPVGAGSSLPQLDFTRVRVSQPDLDTVRVEMTVADLSNPTPPAGKASSFWLTRFQALSLGDHNEKAYRVFYAGAESLGGGPLSFFAGSGLSADGNVPGNGCTTTTGQNCKVLQYPAEASADGAVVGNTIRIDIPLDGGFGEGRPILGDTLFYVTALSGGRNGGSDLYADLDATRSFNFRLGEVVGPVGEGRKVTGGGAIAGTGAGDGQFTLNVFDTLKGKLNYRDDGAGVNFRSSKIVSTTFDESTATAEIRGVGLNNGASVNFTATVVDHGEPGSQDVFAIELSDGYSRGGTLLRGNIQVHQP